jgi:CBS domain containing-hemolysin-like protein
MSPLFFKLMAKIVRRLDPKFEKYRPKKAAYTPTTAEELIDVLARTPKTILSREQRDIIASAMSFAAKPVSAAMLPKSEMTFVHENDFLGPLTLSNLYKSGFEHFPVIGASGRITGLLHTKELNSLEVKETDRAVKYLDENVYYIRHDHTLEMALAAFLRTNCHFFIVIDRTENPVGLITYEMIAQVMLGKKITDNFDADLNVSAVAHRPPQS